MCYAIWVSVASLHRESTDSDTEVPQIVTRSHSSLVPRLLMAAGLGERLITQQVPGFYANYDKYGGVLHFLESSHEITNTSKFLLHEHQLHKICTYHWFSRL